MAKKSSSRLSTPVIVVCVIAAIVLFFIAEKLFTPNSGAANTAVTRVQELDSASSVCITEIMSSNASIIQDETGAYPDWIEITNISSSDVNLKDWKLSKGTSYLDKYFEFPSATLRSGESVLVYCTSSGKNVNNGYYHAPFRLSAAGDTILLFNPSDMAVQSVNIPELATNCSYVRVNRERWEKSDKPTPGLENTEENYEKLISNRTLADSPISITELMAKNVSYADANGQYWDWVEIYNSSSSKAINLAGYSLSDSMDNPRKWIFPDVWIEPGSYMLIYCSGNDIKDVSNPAKPVLHTSFSLSTEKEGAILSDSNGYMIDVVTYDLLKADQSYAKQSDGTWQITTKCTPGMANTFNSAALISGQFAAQNSSGIFINEVMATTTADNGAGSSYDWVEIRNTSAQTVDLSGWGLSDDPSKPRKWQFPAGTAIPAGAYMGVYLSGLDKVQSGALHTNFSLSAAGGETLVVATPEGRIVDRCCLGVQYANISYGRMGDKNGFYYLTAATPGGVNVTSGYESRMSQPVFSQVGGLYTSPIAVTLQCEAGATIYYTLDCSIPDPTNLGGREFTNDPTSTWINNHYQTYQYTGPITIDKTTVVRAISVKNDQLSSLINTQTYFVNVNHTMQVVSLVLDPADLYDYNKGMYVRGPNAKGSLGTGGNLWKDWEKDGNVEIFSLDGKTVISQGCGVKLHGQFSRAENQKAFKIIARSKYGVNRFYADLFPNRDYTEYQSFLLRASGQDWDMTRMRDSILTTLAEGMDVMYQDTALGVLYLNGEYWGQYNLRERINTYSICQWEGWDPALKDKIDLIKANTTVMKGSVDSWNAIREWVAKNGVDTAEKLAYVEQYVDVYNYLNYCALEIYTGNTDLLNCKKYRCAETDGKWRWILFDLDWAFYTDTNSVNRWINQGGVKNTDPTKLVKDNTLFMGLLGNPVTRDYFMQLMADKLAGDWSTAAVMAKITERAELLAPEMPMQLSRWNIDTSKYTSAMKKFTNYANNRPGRILYFFKNKISKAEFEKYFGELARTVKLIDDNGKSFSYYN